MRKTEYPPKVREAIKRRDGGCVFCRMLGNSGFEATQIAHYIPRSRGGIGCEWNGIYICAPHHQELDNGMNSGAMRKIYARYMATQYEDWNPDELIYSKWSAANTAVSSR